MKKIMRVIAAMLALIMMLAVSSFAEEKENEDIVLATVDGEPILFSQIQELIVQYYYYGYIEDYTDVNTVVTYEAENRVLQKKLKENGYFDFTEEEMAAFRTDALDEKQQAIEEYVEYYLSEDTEEARETLRVQAEEVYAGEEEMILDSLVSNAAYDKWTASLELAEIQDEDVLMLFSELAAEDQSYFEEDIPSFEYNLYYGYQSFYMPEGYRKILRLLIPADDELMTAWIDACMAVEEALAAEEPDDSRAATAREEQKKAEEAILDAVKEKTGDILKRLQAGEDFRMLMGEYGEDPYMTGDGAEEGYDVHPDSILFETDMIAATFNEDMKAPGCFTGPFVATEGVTFLYYLYDIPSGPVELTEEIQSMIKEYLENENFSNACQTQIDAWMNECSVMYDEEAITAATEQMAALMEE